MEKTEATLRASVSPPLIFEQSMPGRRALAQAPSATEPWEDLPAHLRRDAPPALPEVSEMQVVRHYTRLSQRNFPSTPSSIRWVPAP